MGHNTALIDWSINGMSTNLKDVAERLSEVVKGNDYSQLNAGDASLEICYASSLY
jgi:hypothetical protein